MRVIRFEVRTPRLFHLVIKRGFSQKPIDLSQNRCPGPRWISLHAIHIEFRIPFWRPIDIGFPPLRNHIASASAATEKSNRLLVSKLPLSGEHERKGVLV